MKLVTYGFTETYISRGILIHTSVKLVTWQSSLYALSVQNFNPHEREARDLSQVDRPTWLYLF